MARILVVDDRQDVATAIARMLRNHETSTETDPRRAIDRVAHGEQFEIVLVDFEMPGMNGQQVSDALEHAAVERPPIVLMMSGGHNVESLFATGRGVLIKPFDGSELRDLVSAMLRDDERRPRA